MNYFMPLYREVKSTVVLYTSLLFLRGTPVSSYSAQTAASAYAHMDPSQVARVFVLGPSHHVHMK